MKALLLSLLAALAVPPALAQDTPPTEQSIRELLALMQAHNMIDTMMAQVDASWRPLMKQALGERQPSEREQQILDEGHAKIQALCREQLRWENFEPMMISVYRNTFSQKEVDGMKAFYRTPIGQAVIAKMPIVMQQTMQTMQGRMADMIPKIQQVQKDLAAQLKAERAAQEEAAAPQPPKPTP